MTSAGGLVPSTDYRAKDSLLSGPAGGVVGVGVVGRQAGYERLIGFDMGGTSTDVCRVEAGERELVFEHTVGDATLFAPAVAVESVAAGGGSICRVDALGNLTVGPESAGAHPGPACYGMGGPLTLTDINLLLGRIDPAQFEIPVQRERAEAALGELLHDLQTKTGETPDTQSVLLGLCAIADERMADAIRRITTRRGVDAAEYALVAFGGAGGLHACAVATQLGISTVLFPTDAGLLSAYGLGHAVVETIDEVQVLKRLEEVAIPPSPVGVVTLAQVRLLGQESALTVSAEGGADAIAERFRAAFLRLYGYMPDPARPIELESLRILTASPPEATPDIAPVAGRYATLYAPPGWEPHTEGWGIRLVYSL
jgi:5-oxoprolinase (ATP-hydrolysing)